MSSPGRDLSVPDSDGRAPRFGLLIAGTETGAAGGEWFESRDPANDQPVAEFSRASAADVVSAVDAARHAFARWRLVSATDRGRMMQTVASKIAESIDELALWETRDCGKRLTLARQDIRNAARYFEFFGNLAADLGGRQLPVSPDVLNLTVREPFGVSAQINAWNFPLSMAARSCAAALAAGNAVVMKTSEHAPATTAMLGRLLGEADIPPGVVNILHGYGHDCGASLASAANVDLVTFTGSVETGVSVAASAARAVRACVLELGGKSPIIVFRDADLELAARQLARAVVDSNGQCCDLPSRALIERDVHDTFVELVTTEFAAMTWGPGREDHDWGPLINAVQCDRVSKMVERACVEGAWLACGGSRRHHPQGGAYFEPTILVNVRSSMEIATSEVFGPVLAALPFDDEPMAIHLANETPYGLAAFVWTSDVGRAIRVTRDVRAGQVYVNCFGSGDPVMTPFGGTGLSGYGREKGYAALETYTQLKNVCFSSR
jgi:aldehyde dehydrogenase (NAD+)